MVIYDASPACNVAKFSLVPVPGLASDYMWRSFIDPVPSPGAPGVWGLLPRGRWEGDDVFSGPRVEE